MRSIAALCEKENSLGLDIGNLKGESTTATIMVAGGSFDVEFHAHATTSDWQSEIGALQRDYQEAKQDVLRSSSDTEIAEAEAERDSVGALLTSKVGEVIVGWDLQEDGEDIPISALGLDRLSMSLQQAIFEKVLTEGSGGDEVAKKRRNRRSRRGSS